MKSLGALRKKTLGIFVGLMLFSSNFCKGGLFGSSKKTSQPAPAASAPAPASDVKPLPAPTPAPTPAPSVTPSPAPSVSASATPAAVSSTALTVVSQGGTVDTKHDADGAEYSSYMPATDDADFSSDDAILTSSAPASATGGVAQAQDDLQVVLGQVNAGIQKLQAMVQQLSSQLADGNNAGAAAGASISNDLSDSQGDLERAVNILDIHDYAGD